MAPEVTASAPPVNLLAVQILGLETLGGQASHLLTRSAGDSDTGSGAKSLRTTAREITLTAEVGCCHLSDLPHSRHTFLRAKEGLFEDIHDLEYSLL